MGKKILVLCLDANNDRLLPEKYTVKYHISNTKLEKGDSLEVSADQRMQAAPGV